MRNKKPQPFILKNLKWISLSLLILSLLFIYFIPRAVMYSDYMMVRLIQPLFILFIIPLFAFTALVLFTKKGKLSIAVACISVFVVGPTFERFQDHREKVELQKNGVWGKSIVVDRKRSTTKGSRSWVIKCKYEANDHSYETLYHDDINYLHPIGDTIKIIYSRQFPEIYALGYEWGK
ncbi:MAG: hypothetical protein ACXVA2_02695 [Mucilaginibacter sp.]